MSEVKDDGNLEFWAVLELFGHQRIAGFVREVSLGGDAMLRVDVPEITYTQRIYGEPDDAARQQTIPAFTKFYSPKSVYAMTPCSEEVARAAMQSFRSEPIQQLKLCPALPAPAETVPRDHHDRGEDEQDDDWNDDEDVE